MLFIGGPLHGSEITLAIKGSGESDLPTIYTDLASGHQYSSGTIGMTFARLRSDGTIDQTLPPLDYEHDFYFSMSLREHDQQQLMAVLADAIVRCRFLATGRPKVGASNGHRPQVSYYATCEQHNWYGVYPTLALRAAYARNHIDAHGGICQLKFSEGDPPPQSAADADDISQQGKGDNGIG